MPEPRLEIGRLFNNASEEPEEVAYVNGKFPEWLKGNYLRTGPGQFDLDNTFAVNHFFDGYAILTKFNINGDKVILKKKFLETEAYKRACKAKKPMICEFGTRAYPDPSKSFFSRMMPAIIPELTDNGQIGLFNIGKKTFACGEVCHFHEVNLDTLANDNHYDSQKLFGCQMLSSHPLTDLDGTVYNIGISFLTGLKYNIIKVPPPSGSGNPTSKDLLKNAKILATIPSSSSSTLSYLHSFGMTKNYIIYIEQPYVLRVSKVLKASLHKADSQQDWMEWRPESKNRFIVVCKKSGSVISKFISSTGFFYFHFINCFEEFDQIVIDLPTFSNPNFLNSLTVERLRAGDTDIGDGSLPRGTRYVLPIVDLKHTPEGVDLVGVKSTATAIRNGNQIIVTPEFYTEAGLEFPTMNRDYLTRKFNYYYGTGTASRGYFENAIAKVDIRDKETILHREHDCCFFGEPMFVPKPDGTSEDDGVVIVAANDTRDNHKDFLLVLDAKSMKELGRVQFKSKLPFSLHGLFVFTD